MRALMKTLLAAVMIMTLLVTGGCGSGSGSAKEPEPFTLGDYTYKIEKIKKTADGYEVSLLIEGDSAPVIITNGAARSGVDMELASGDKTFSSSQAGFSVLGEDKKVGNFGARASFSFSVPDGSDAPDKAVVTDASSGDSTEVDLSGIKIEE